MCQTHKPCQNADFLHLCVDIKVFKNANGSFRGNDLSTKVEYNMSTVDLNNGLLSFGISFANDVPDEQIIFILKKSKIQK